MEHDDKPTLQVVGDEQGDAESPKATAEPSQRGLGRRGVYLLPNLITTCCWMGQTAESPA